MSRRIESASSMTYYPRGQQKLTSEEQLSIQRRRVKEPWASPEFLDLYSRDPDLNTRICVARHSNTTVETLSDMVKDESDKVCNIIAQRPEATADMLYRLVVHSDSKFVWRNVARHANTGQGTLEILSRKDDRMVLFGVLKNQNTSKETISRFIEHEDEVLRSVARKRLQEMANAPAKPAPKKVANNKSNSTNKRGSVFVG